MVKKLRGMWAVLHGAAVELIADHSIVLAASIAFCFTTESGSVNKTTPGGTVGLLMETILYQPDPGEADNNCEQPKPAGSGAVSANRGAGPGRADGAARARRR